MAGDWAWRNGEAIRSAGRPVESELPERAVKHRARLNAIHCLIVGIGYPERDLGWENLSSHGRRRSSRNMIVDGALFEILNPEQVQILERIHMHE